MQVIRSQTVQKTSSRWSSSSSSATASPSPPSIMQLSSSRAPKDKYTKTNKQTHKRTTSTTNSNTSSNATNSTTSTPFKATNGIHHHHHDQHKLYSKFHPSTGTNSNSSSLSAANLVNGRNNNVRRRNWPQIVTENSALEICDNDHDNDHQHDNDYTVDHASDDDGNGDTGDIYAVDDNHSSHDNDSLTDHNVGDGDEVYRLNRLNKSSGFSKYQPTFSTNATENGLNHNDEAEKHHYLLRHDSCYGAMDNGHSSSNSSLNSHSGNSCSNTSNQLFLLDTAPSLKLSNLMVSKQQTEKQIITTFSATTSSNSYEIFLPQKCSYLLLTWLT